RPEQRHLPHDVGRRDGGGELTTHGLGDDEVEIMGKAIRKPLTPVRGGIGMTGRGLHPNLAIAHLDRADRHILRPQVEAAAAFEIEAGVVPRTGQDTVLDAAALEREAHVRATIVEGEHAPAVVDHEDRTIATVHEEPPLLFQLLEASRKREVLVRRIHEHTSRSPFAALGTLNSVPYVGMASRSTRALAREPVWPSQQAVSTPRGPAPNERRRRRPRHGRRTGTTGEWPPGARGSPPAPARDGPGRGPPPRGRVRSRCTSRGARTRPGTRRRRRTSAGRRRTPGGPRCARGVWPPVRVTSTPGATSYSFSNGRIWLWNSFKNRLPVRRSASGNPGGM